MASPKRAPRWRAVFLRALGKAGNVQFAAAAAGVNPASAYHIRKREPAFAKRWDTAVARGRARVAAGMAPARPKRPPVVLDRDSLVYQRTAAGVTALVRAGPGRWSIGVERRFLAALAETACVRHACAEIEMSAAAVYQRRQRDADFAARWAAALREGEARIPALLTASVLAAFDPARAAAGIPTASVGEAIAIARLKGIARLPDDAGDDGAAARASIARKLDALDRFGERAARRRDEKAGT